MQKTPQNMMPPRGRQQNQNTGRPQTQPGSQGSVPAFQPVPGGKLLHRLVDPGAAHSAGHQRVQRRLPGAHSGFQGVAPEVIHGTHPFSALGLETADLHRALTAGDAQSGLRQPQDLTRGSPAL